MDIRYGTLYIFNYQAKDGSYYFISKVDKEYYFVRLYNELTSVLSPHISKNNQVYLRYQGHFSLNKQDKTLSIIKNDVPSRF